MRITVTMPGAEAHSIVRSQDGIHVMIDYFTDFTMANSDDGLCLESTLRSIAVAVRSRLRTLGRLIQQEIVLVCRRSESQTELGVESRRDYDYNPES
jgi:hypothetical protein